MCICCWPHIWCTGVCSHLQLISNLGETISYCLLSVAVGREDQQFPELTVNHKTSATAQLCISHHGALHEQDTITLVCLTVHWATYTQRIIKHQPPCSLYSIYTVNYKTSATTQLCINHHGALHQPPHSFAWRTHNRITLVCLIVHEPRIHRTSLHVFKTPPTIHVIA